ncbi:hypothetical protein ACOMHN_065752 [Nucella lapillus]
MNIFEQDDHCELDVVHQNKTDFLESSIIDVSQSGFDIWEENHRPSCKGDRKTLGNNVQSWEGLADGCTKRTGTLRHHLKTREEKLKNACSNERTTWAHRKGCCNSIRPKSSHIHLCGRDWPA